MNSSFHNVRPFDKEQKKLQKVKNRLLWQYRLKIALGIATRLNYLHTHDLSQPAFHRDIKSAKLLIVVYLVMVQIEKQKKSFQLYLQVLLV